LRPLFVVVVLESIPLSKSKINRCWYHFAGKITSNKEIIIWWFSVDFSNKF